MVQKSTELANGLSYIGGLFDLGGCIKIEVPSKGQKASLYVWITSKNFIIMDTLQSVGAYIGKKQDGQYRAKWKDNRAYTLLKSIMPYLKIKKDQAKLGLEFIEERNQNPQSDTDIVYRLRLKLLKREEEGGT